MSTQEKQTVDAQARVRLPKGFAKAKVVLEQVSDSEVRVRLAGRGAAKGSTFAEEHAAKLSDRDRDRFLELVTAQRRPTAALRKAMSSRSKHHG